MTRFLYFFLLLLTVQNLCSQYKDLKFRHITTLNGLSQGTVKSFMQDDNGFIWVGTRNGLNRFDGYRFTVFKNIPGDSTSLNNNHITDIKKAGEGKLWIATWGDGINLFDLKKQKFSSKLNTEYNLNNLFVHCILEDTEGNLWIGTDGNGLFKYSTRNKKITRYSHNSAQPGSISDNTIRALYEDHRKNIWIGTQNGGLNLYNSRNDNFINQHNPDQFKFPSATQIRAITELNGELCLGTYGNGLILKNMQTGAERIFNYKANQLNTLPHDNILSLMTDRNNFIWIGTENGGLSVLDPKEELFYRYQNDPLDNSSINSNSIYTIFEDKDGNVWSGTWNGGINLVQQDAQQFRHYSHNSSPWSLSDNHVLSITGDSEGYLWVGTDGGGLNMLSPKTGRFTHFLHNPNKNSISGNYVLSVCEAGNKEIWIGTYGGGISIFNKNTRKFRHLKYEQGKPGTITSNYVWIIYKDSRNRMWMGMCPGGINVYDPETGKMSYYLHQEKDSGSLSHNNIHSIFEDSKGNIWIGTNGGGLNKIDAVTGKIIHYGIKEGLSHNSLGHLYEDKNHNLWIGTDAGLNYLNTQTGKITNYGPKQGLPNCFIYGILEDSNNNLWISSNEGLIRFNPETNNVSVFSVNDGLQSNELNLNAFCKTKCGAMYFGGSNGFNKFFPDKIKESNSSTAPVLTDFLLFNRSVEISGDNSPLENQISYTKEITLPYDASVFSFEFAVLNFKVPGNNQYAYKMEGFEKDWNYSSTNKTATYTNLDPGDYTFLVKAISPDNHESEVVSLKILITPPIWGTIWFRILIIMAIFSGIALIFQIRISSVRKQNVILEEKVKNRTREILEINSILKNQTTDLNHANQLLQERNQKVEEMAKELMVQKENLIRMNNDLNDLNATKDKFLSIIAHDIKNPFNTILGFTTLLKINYKKWTDDKKIHSIDLINRSSQHLYNLLESLLQWSRAQRGIIDYHPEDLKVKDLFEACHEFFRSNLNEKNIRFEISDNCNELIIYADKSMIETVLRNIIGNAVKFTDYGGKILIDAVMDSENSLIKVSDTGVGMTEFQMKQLFRIDSSFSTSGTNKETGTGLGLLLSNEFVARHGGTIEVESKPGIGSVFTIKIPAKKTRQF